MSYFLESNGRYVGEFGSIQNIIAMRRLGLPNTTKFLDVGQITDSTLKDAVVKELKDTKYSGIADSLELSNVPIILTDGVS